jgi:hypothetical protein
MVLARPILKARRRTIFCAGCMLLIATANENMRESQLAKETRKAVRNPTRSRAQGEEDEKKIQISQDVMMPTTG